MRRGKILDTAAELTILEGVLSGAAEKRKLRAFLDGFLTSAERTILAHRLLVARLLVAGWSYRKIRAETGASPNTIAAVDRWLRKENPRYRRLFPIRHRRQQTVSHTRFSDVEYGLPGSIKDLYKSLTGTALW